MNPRSVRWSRAGYLGLLARIGRVPRIAILTSVLVTLGGAAILPTLGAVFLPDLREGHMILHMVAIPGTALQESQRLSGLVTADLKAIPGVRAVAAQIGRAEAGEDTAGPHYSEIHIDLEPGLDGAAQRKVETEIRTLIAGFPGAAFSLKSFLTERIEETVSGFTASVVINVIGSDLDRIEAAARSVARELAEVKGARDVQQAAPAGLPQVTVALRPVDLRHWGLDPVEVLEAVRTAYQGDVVGQSYRGNAVVNVLVILDAQVRGRLSAVGDLPLRAPGGRYVRLSQVADVYESAGRYQVQHLGAQRMQAVTANVAGRDVAAFVAAAKRKIAREVRLPEGVYVTFSGAAEAQAAARRDLLFHAGLAGFGIVVLLAIVTGSAANLILVLVNLPLRLRGRCRGGRADRRRPVARFDRGLRDPGGHLAAQQRDDDRPLRADGEPGRPSLERRNCRRGCRRPDGTDPDDLAGHRARPAAARPRRGRARPGDRGADGARDPRRPRQLDGSEPSGASDPGRALRPLPSGAGRGFCVDARSPVRSALAAFQRIDAGVGCFGAGFELSRVQSRMISRIFDAECFAVRSDAR